MDRGAWWATVHGCKESDMTEQLTYTQYTQTHTYIYKTISVFCTSENNTTW